MIHTPACSKLPMCGSAMITPRPAFRWAKMVASFGPWKRMPDTSRSVGVTDSRNTSSQYLA